MPERVVHVFQRIDIDVDDRDAQVVASRARQGNVNAVVEDGSHRKIGQIVADERHRAFDNRHWGCLVGMGDETGDLATGSDSSDDRHGHWNRFAALGQQLELTLPGPA